MMQTNEQKKFIGQCGYLPDRALKEMDLGPNSTPKLVQEVRIALVILKKPPIPYMADVGFFYRAHG